jgi:hypothetical protein
MNWRALVPSIRARSTKSQMATAATGNQKEMALSTRHSALTRPHGQVVY